MNLREYQVLDATNIATAVHSRWVKGEGHHYQATAAQIAETMLTDDRYGPEYAWATSRIVGAILTGLAKDWPARREPLVERVGTKKWCLTDAGARVLNA